ncbi:MAG: serine/threonine-protein kinase [Myxococcota bacterium]
MRTLTFNHIIGAGSMGTVYHAELRVPGGFRRPCAVKVIKAQGPDRAHFVSRMRDEARLLGMLQDEQILGVNELVLVEGDDAVMMEYVEGVDLQQLLRVHQMPPRALAELGAEIAGTLHRAHSAKHPTTAEPLNVIHRDIKPANVMVTVRGGVRLLDFGVARAAFASRESHTQGLVLGTLNYFPPEILAGEEPTPAVDIYSLGISMWECAAGKEWGPPRVQQARFERRVDQRLAELGGEHTPLLPVLRQILQWDPELRPDGGVVERALLHAADSSAGRGLRTWAREAVPPVLADVRKQPQPDGLVGQTIEVRSFAEGSTPVPSVRKAGPSSLMGESHPGSHPSALSDAPVIDPPPPSRGVPDPTSTWNVEADSDLPLPVLDDPPPAKVSRKSAEKKSASKKSSGKAAKKTSKKRRKGLSPIIAVMLGIVLGLIVLGLIVFVLVLAVVIGWLLVA